MRQVCAIRKSLVMIAKALHLQFGDKTLLGYIEKKFKKEYDPRTDYPKEEHYYRLTEASFHPLCIGKLEAIQSILCASIGLYGTQLKSFPFLEPF